MIILSENFLVCPDGLPVRTGRTESPKPADSRLLLIPKVVPPITLGYFAISVPYSSISVPYSTQKKSFFDFTLPSSLFRSESLYLLGFTDGRGNKHPSRLPPVQGPLFSKWEGASKRIRFDALQAIVPSICQAVALCISVCLQVSLEVSQQPC